MDNLSRNDADGARTSVCGNMDMQIGFRGFGCVFLRYETVGRSRDIGKSVNAGGNWALLRTEVRAPAASIAWFRLGRLLPSVRFTGLQPLCAMAGRESISPNQRPGGERNRFLMPALWHSLIRLCMAAADMPWSARISTLRPLAEATMRRSCSRI